MRDLTGKVAWITGAGTGIGAAAAVALAAAGMTVVVSGRRAEKLTDVAFLARLPAHVCINELTVSPTWNRGYVAQAQALTRR